MGRPPGDEHRNLQDLLPWYVNGQLDAAEQARVEGHLHDCALCQAELKVQRQLDTEIKRLPINVEEGWSQMRKRLEAEDRPRRSPWAWLSALAAGGRPGSLGGMLAGGRNRGGGWAAAPGWAMAGGLGLVSAALLLTYAQPERYHALSSAPTAAAAGNVLVMFRPETREKDMRAALQDSGARLVDGPTAAGAYVLQVPVAGRADALARLRARAEIELAEPIGSAAR
jgi:hypothetical protein